MKPLDDMLPEENEPQYKELITLLQHSSPRFAPVPLERQQQILARVRECLGIADSESVVSQDVIDSAQFSALPPKEVPRPHRFSQLVSSIAAVLVVGMLIGTALLLFRPGHPSTGNHPTQTPAGGLIGTPVTISAQAGGLEMTMRITSGPYFLGEMLVADLSLTNHSQTTYLLQGTPNMPGQPPDTCHPPLTVAFSGGEGPSDTTLRSALSDIASCWNGPGSEGPVQLQPGQTITVHQYLALTSSGHVTFTARGTFQEPALGQDGVVHMIPAAGPLDGHWPSLSVLVARQATPTRSISLQRQGLQVHVDAPPAIRSHLLYMSVFICNLGKGSTQRAGADNWIALTGETIPPPDCAFSVNQGTGTLERWSYVAGAPGYAIASGRYPS